MIAQDLTPVLAQTLIIDNCTGANSPIATETVARADRRARVIKAAGVKAQQQSKALTEDAEVHGAHGGRTSKGEA